MIRPIARHFSAPGLRYVGRRLRPRQLHNEHEVEKTERHVGRVVCYYRRSTPLAGTETPPYGSAANSLRTPCVAVCCLLIAFATVRPSAAQLRPAVTALAYSPDGKRLAVGTRGRVILYDTATWKPTAELPGVEGYARALAFTPDSATVAVGCGLPARKGEAFLWNPATGACDHRYPPRKDNVEAVAFSADGKSLLLGANDNRAHYFPLIRVGAGPELEEHNGRVTAAAFSSKPDYIFATGGMDKVVKIWDRKTAKTVINFDQAQAGITGLVFLKGGDQLAGTSLDGNLYWWQVGYDEKKREYSGSVFRTSGAHGEGALALAISADGQRLITGGADHKVIVWKADDGSQIKVLSDAAQPIYAVALSPDGKIAAGGGREGTVFLWDVEAGKLLYMIVPGSPAQAPPPPAAPAAPTKDGKP